LRPVRIEVGYPAATTVDIVARAVAQRLTEAWGQPVIVENRPGAAGNVAAELVAKAAPDGYTLLSTNNGLVVSAISYRKPLYSPQTDLKPVVHVASGPHVLIVTVALPVGSVQQLIALARSRPGQLSHASVGVGSPSHLAAELFKNLTGVKLLHVPYKGSNQVLIDVATGDVAMSFSGIAPALPLVQRHKVKALGVTSATRSDALPNVPTFRESGLPNFEVAFWYGLFAPVKTPPEIIAQLNGEIDRALRSQDLRRHFSALGLDAIGGSASDFDLFFKSEIARWSKVVKANGILLDQDK
jgi:tripartite-type tricarboxylate transporter receptor subunit TctC